MFNADSLPMTPSRNSEWVVLRHVEHEHIGTLAMLLERARMRHRYVDLFHGDPLPENPAQFGGLIVMGGPMGVYESSRYPFLKPEIALIRRAADAGLPVLGICLGSQLIAASLGASVYPGPTKEIGWYEVEVTAPEDDWTVGLSPRFMGFHWHGDTFDLPAGAVRLFRSSLYENQGFRWGKNVLALQFHCEVNRAMIGEWLSDEGCRAEMAALPEVDPETIRLQTAEWSGKLEELGGELFGRFLKAVSESVPRTQAAGQRNGKA
jgi:GMP synthase (glutamine-hydrolysing)